MGSILSWNPSAMHCGHKALSLGSLICEMDRGEGKASTSPQAYSEVRLNQGIIWPLRYKVSCHPRYASWPLREVQLTPLA